MTKIVCLLHKYQTRHKKYGVKKLFTVNIEATYLKDPVYKFTRMYSGTSCVCFILEPDELVFSMALIFILSRHLPGVLSLCLLYF